MSTVLQFYVYPHLTGNLKMRNLVLLAITALAFVGCQPAFCYQLTSIPINSYDIVSVHDGDTFTVDIPYLPAVFGEKMSVRLNGIDTPEMSSKCISATERAFERTLAVKARDYLAKRLLEGHRISLDNPLRDKYFRVLVTVYVDGININDELLAKGLATSYDGGTKIGWCGGGS